MLQRLIASWREWWSAERVTEDLTKTLGERRVWVRYPSNLATTVQPEFALPDSLQLSAKVQNISRGGINLLVERELDPGTQLLIERPHGDHSSTAPLAAYLVRSTMVNKGTWTLGCTFADRLTQQELTEFGASLTTPDVPDKRSWVRYPCDIPVTYQLLRSTDTPATSAKAIDVSATGISLLVREDIAVGTALGLEMQRPDGQPAPARLACVLRVLNQAGGRRLLGCNFVRELTDDELQAWVAEETPAPS